MAGKPWFQTELERVTRERWRVTRREDSTALMCTHRMKVFVPYPPGLDRTFLNRDAERHFVGKVLDAHQPFVKVPQLFPSLV